MGVKFGVCLLYLFLFSAVNCNGYSGDHYFSEDPVDAFDTDDEICQINRIPKTSAKSLEDPFNGHTELLYYVPSWRDLDPKSSEAYRIEKRSPSRKKRAISKRSADDDVRKTYDGEGVPPMNHEESVKTVQFSSSFTPGFDKKRSNSPDQITSFFISSGKPGDTYSRDIIGNPSATYFNPRNWFRSGLGGSNKKGYSKKQLNPRLGRSSDTVQLTAGSGFTPRLGRSENSRGVQLTAGSAFTPRLGRSGNAKEVQLKVGSAFTPRLGRSDYSSDVRLTAGSAFTPRLGRSGNAKEVQLKVGSAFTPRLGRSDYSRDVQLTAGSGFTPRLGRSDYSRDVQLTAGSAFTPRLGRSDYSSDVRLTAGSAFTPRLGRSENSREVQLTAGSGFTPRLGRSDYSRDVQLTAGSAFTPRLGRSNNPTAVRLNAEKVFTPRLGRSSEQQIQLNAGSAFTPRFGRSEEADFGYDPDGLASRTEEWNTM